MIPVGTFIDERKEPVELVSDDLELIPHLNKPWLLQYVGKEVGIDLFGDNGPAVAKPATIDPKHLSRHTLIVGKTGSGKTRFATHLAIEQLKAGAGASLVFIDAKEKTVTGVMAAVERAGISPDIVTVMLPSHGHPPSWNPLDARALGISAKSASTTFMSVLTEVYGSGIRWPEILSNTTTLAAANRLTMLDVKEMLSNYSYLTAVLKMELDPAIIDPETAHEIRQYFRDRYSAMTNYGKNLEPVEPALVRINAIIDNPFIRAMYCSDQP